MAWGLVNLDVDSVAEKEVYDPKTGRYKEDVGDRLGNWVVGMLSGGSDRRGQIDEKVQERYLDKLEDDFGEELDKYGNVHGYSRIGREELKSLSEAQLKREIAKRKATKDARSNVIEQYSLDPNKFLDITDPAKILGRGARLGKDEERELRLADEAKARELRLSDEARIRAQGQLDLASQQLYNDKVRQQGFEREDAKEERLMLMEERRDLRNDKSLAQQRELTAQTNQMQLGFQYAQLDREDRRSERDRKDRMIMMLLQGFDKVSKALTL